MVRFHLLMLYLSHDIKVNLSRSNLINFDAAKNGNMDVAEHGWGGSAEESELNVVYLGGR